MRLADSIMIRSLEMSHASSGVGSRSGHESVPGCGSDEATGRPTRSKKSTAGRGGKLRKSDGEANRNSCCNYIFSKK
jgi:hypothetical protein